VLLEGLEDIRVVDLFDFHREISILREFLHLPCEPLFVSRVVIFEFGSISGLETLPRRAEFLQREKKKPK